MAGECALPGLVLDNRSGYAQIYGNEAKSNCCIFQLRDVNLTEGYIDLRLEGSKTHRNGAFPLSNSCVCGYSFSSHGQQKPEPGKDNLFDVSFILPGESRSSKRCECDASKDPLFLFAPFVKGVQVCRFAAPFQTYSLRN